MDRNPQGSRRVRPVRATRPAGFTLIEMLVVLVILALIAGIAVPQVLHYLGRARTDTAKLQIKGLGSALDLYRLDNGSYPHDLDALLHAPANDPQWNGPYVRSADQLLDPWHRPFEYRFPGQHGDYDLFTLGADNAPGGTDENQDVTNW